MKNESAYCVRSSQIQSQIFYFHSLLNTIILWAGALRMYWYILDVMISFVIAYSYHIF